MAARLAAWLAGCWMAAGWLASWGVGANISQDGGIGRGGARVERGGVGGGTMRFVPQNTNNEIRVTANHINR